MNANWLLIFVVNFWTQRMWSILLIWNDNVKDKDTQFIWNTWISVKITIELFISDSSVKRICNVCKVSNFIETKEMTCCCCIVFYLVYIFNSFKQYVNLFSTLSFSHLPTLRIPPFVPQYSYIIFVWRRLICLYTQQYSN